MPYNDMYEFYDENYCNCIREFNSVYRFVRTYEGNEVLELIEKLKEFKSITIQYKDKNFNIDLLWLNFDNLKLRGDDLYIDCCERGDIVLKNFLTEPIRLYKEDLGDTLVVEYEYDNFYIYFMNEKVE